MSCIALRAQLNLAFVLIRPSVLRPVTRSVRDTHPVIVPAETEAPTVDRVVLTPLLKQRIAGTVQGPEVVRAQEAVLAEAQEAVLAEAQEAVLVEARERCLTAELEMVQAQVLGAAQARHPTVEQVTVQGQVQVPGVAQPQLRTQARSFTRDEQSENWSNRHGGWRRYSWPKRCFVVASKRR